MQSRHGAREQCAGGEGGGGGGGGEEGEGGNNPMWLSPARCAQALGPFESSTRIRGAGTEHSKLLSGKPSQSRAEVSGWRQTRLGAARHSARAPECLCSCPIILSGTVGNSPASGISAAPPRACLSPEGKGADGRHAAAAARALRGHAVSRRARGRAPLVGRRAAAAERRRAPALLVGSRSLRAPWARSEEDAVAARRPGAVRRGRRRRREEGVGGRRRQIAQAAASERPRGRRGRRGRARKRQRRQAPRAAEGGRPRRRPRVGPMEGAAARRRRAPPGPS
ncbi:unnamed protein product, partial [Prorocentrum cordatum]